MRTPGPLSPELLSKTETRVTLSTIRTAIDGLTALLFTLAALRSAHRATQRSLAEAQRSIAGTPT